jgi:hypothetical protein
LREKTRSSGVQEFRKEEGERYYSTASGLKGWVGIAFQRLI